MEFAKVMMPAVNRALFPERYAGKPAATPERRGCGSSRDDAAAAKDPTLTNAGDSGPGAAPRWKQAARRKRRRGETRRSASSPRSPTGVISRISAGVNDSPVSDGDVHGSATPPGLASLN